MQKKTCRPEEIIARLRQAEVLLGEGKRVPEVTGPHSSVHFLC